MMLPLPIPELGIYCYCSLLDACTWSAAPRLEVFDPLPLAFTAGLAELLEAEFEDAMTTMLVLNSSRGGGSACPSN